MKRLCAVALPALVLVIAGCGSSSSSSSGSSSSTPSTTPAAKAPSSVGAGAVDMKGIAFSPKTLTAKVGQTIKWTNSDSVAHNVTHVGGPSFASSPNFSAGGTFSLKLTKAGTIQYRCTLHPGMDGTIVVSP